MNKKLMATDFTVQSFTSEELGEKMFRISHPALPDVFVFPKKLKTSYALFGVKYGSIDSEFLMPDTKRKCVPDGIAHFLEHKLFENPDGSDASEKFSELGADVNAYTSYNKTAYLFSCTENFGDALRELVYFVTHPHFEKESVKREIGIITEEILMYEDSPYERCFSNLMKALYENNSVSKNICGDVNSIRKITPSLLLDCYRSFYHPSNMALVICADTDAESVIDVLCECDFGFEESIGAASRIPQKDEEKAALGYTEDFMQVSKPVFNIGIKDVNIPSSPTERDKKDIAMSILCDMIFSHAGELYTELFESGKISPSFSHGYSICKDFSLITVSGEADEPKEIFEIFKNYLAKLRKNGLSRKDFERCKRVMYSDFVKSFDSSEEIANILLGFVFEGSDMFEYQRMIGKISYEDVCEQFENAFSEDFMTLSVIYPLEFKNNEKGKKQNE